jgi:integrase
MPSKKSKFGLFQPPGTSTWYWRRRYKGESLGGSTGETNRTRAREAAELEFKNHVRDIDAEVADGRAPLTLSRTFEIYCEEVCAGKPGAEAAARELAWAESILGADTQTRDLGQSDITKLRNARRVMTTTRDAGKDEKGRLLQKLVSPSTVNRTMQCVRAALYHVRNHHEAFLKSNLKFAISKEEARQREVSEEEEAAVLAALREDFHPIFAFALFSGIRETGVCTLTWDKVDLRNARVTFQAKRRRTDPPGFVRWAVQPLGPAELELLQSLKAAKHHPHSVFTYVAQGKKGGKGGTGQGGEYVAGKRYPITVEQLTTRWQRDRAKAALTAPTALDLNWHDLRHTFASRLLRHSGRMERVQQALNHADIRTTMRHYAHVLDADVRESKSEAQEAQNATPTMKKLQGFLQGRSNLKVVG